MTPLKMAAIRNNFIIVQYLLKAGAERIREPKLEGLSEASLSEVVEYLDIYRALSSPAYLGLAHPNALSNAFKLTGRLRKIAGSWEAVNKEFYDLADQVERFCASLLDYVANSVELGTLFRQSDDPEVVHDVAQVKKAVDFDQKAFVAHAYTQKIMSINFYRNIDTHSAWFRFLSLLTMFGYPFICLAYIIVQHPRLKAFLAIPHIKLCIFFGSDLAIFACYAAVCVGNDPRITDIVTVFIVIFCVALSWKHICDIIKFGIGDFLGYGANILESIILIISFVLLMCNWITLLLDVYEARARKRHSELVAMVNNVTVTSDLKLSNATVTDRLEQFVSLDWNDPHIVFITLLGVVILPNAIRAFNTALNSYQDLYSIWESTVGALSDMLKFVTVFAIFHLSFAIGLFGLYASQKKVYADDLAEEGYQSIPNAMLTLWWIFNSMGDKAELNSQVTFVNVVHIVIVGLYYIGALVLVNTLIAILSSKFESVAENSDTEWKFGRTKMWLRFIRTDIALPPPFNLVPTTGFIIRLFRNCCSFCTSGCTQTSQNQPEKPEDTTNHNGNARKVMKEILKRYNTTQIEKPDDGDSIGIDDLRQLNQDFVTVKFNVQTNLQVIKDMIDAIWVTIGHIQPNLPIIDNVEDKIPGTRTEVVDMFQTNYPVIDDDIGSIRMAINEVIEALNYRPEVAPKPSLKRIVQDLIDGSSKVPPDPTSGPTTEPTPEQEKYKTVGKRRRGSSLTQRMANMFAMGRTVDNDKEVTEEVQRFRLSFTDA